MIVRQPEDFPNADKDVDSALQRLENTKELYKSGIRFHAEQIFKLPGDR